MANDIIILFGLKHSGKSTLGKELSKKLAYEFLDTDDLIEKAEGMSVRDLYNQKGAAAFMEAEAKVCADFAANCGGKKVVLSTGGGICDNQAALENLKPAGVFVFLKTDVEISVRRIVRKVGVDEKGNFTGVPAFVRKQNPKTMEDIKKLLCEKFIERAEQYKKLSEISVELGDASIEENVAILFNAVN